MVAEMFSGKHKCSVQFYMYSSPSFLWLAEIFLLAGFVGFLYAEKFGDVSMLSLLGKYKAASLAPFDVPPCK